MLRGKPVTPAWRSGLKDEWEFTKWQALAQNVLIENIAYSTCLGGEIERKEGEEKEREENISGLLNKQRNQFGYDGVGAEV